MATTTLTAESDHTGSQHLFERPSESTENASTQVQEKHSTSHVKKKLSLLQTISVLFSSVGGTSVFIATSTILSNTGSVGLSLLVVVLSGLLNYSLAMCFAEVAVLLPKSGGPYFFLLSVFGPCSAFMFFWGFLFFIIIPVWSVTSFGAAVYIVQLFFPGCRPPILAVKLLAVVILVLVVVLNCLYIEYINKVQNFLSLAKVVAYLLIIVCGIYGWVNGDAKRVGNFDDLFEGTADQPGQVAVGFLTGMFLYGGWQIITFLLEEMKAPQKNLPRALQFSIGLTTTMFSLVLLSYFVLITPLEMKLIDAVAVIFVERVSRSLGPIMAILITLMSIGSLNAMVFGQSHVLVAVAKNRHLPQVFASVSNTYHMPWIVPLFLCSLSIVLLMSGSLKVMIEMISFYAVAMSLCVLACLLALRVTEPHKHRPVKVWLVTAIGQVLINTALLVMSIVQEPEAFGRMVLFLLAGLPVYLVTVRWSKKPAVVRQFMERATILLQKLLLIRLL